MVRFLSTILFIIGLLASCSSPELDLVSDRVDYNFDVKPILVQNCYLCHGPDSSSRKANLRLDTYQGATALLEDSLRAVVPGNSRQSELIRRISHLDPEVKMPPPESNFKLSAKDIQLITRWIEQGARYDKHWSFIPPRLVVPKTYDDSANPIDDYITEKLRKNDLTPSARASKTSLIRRVSYLLTGLPPTINEIDDFIIDESEQSYEKMLDRYLASPAFGERWARHWLDVVRYAETKGHEFDYGILGAWQYRDYLIRAFNEDLPYDQLIREHLAGDLLANKRYNKYTGVNESHLATTFFSLPEGTHSPVDIRKDEADRIDNIIDVTSKTFQGLTVACARCHDHKFDPIPTTDYYSMYGLIESTRFSAVPVHSNEKMDSLLLKIGEIDEAIRQNSRVQKVSRLTKLPAINWIGDFRNGSQGNWRTNGYAFHSIEPNSLAPVNSDLVRTRTGMMSSRYLTTGIFGALRSPTFTIKDDFLGLRLRGLKSTVRIIIDNFQLIQNPIYGELEKNIENPRWHNLSVNVSNWKGRKAYVEIVPGSFTAHQYSLSNDAFVEVESVFSYNSKWPLDAQMQVHSSANHIPQTVNKLLHERQALAVQIRDTSFVYGVYDGDPINSPVFIRGNKDNLSTQVVPRAFLSALDSGKVPFEGQGSGRLEFSEAIANPENPLTARVMVNRIWHHMFGSGIVETVDNFGTQGKLPTHPGLLDYLALKFVEEGWSVKNIIKKIAMSNTFQRSVESANPDNADPANRLLSHFPLRRLEAEAIRDGLLYVGGNIDLTMYGKPIPVHLTEFMNGRGKPKRSGPLDGDGRRSIYQEVRRNFLDPMMITFDRPIPFSTVGNRNVTNVPAQSLILMNDPFVIHQAQLMGEVILQSKYERFEDKIDYCYRLALSRSATKEEISQARIFFEKIEAAGNGRQQVTNAATWQQYCHTLFNLKEFIYLL